MKSIQIKFLYILHTGLTHNGSEPENLNFREMVASLALFYFLKRKTKNTQLLNLSKPCKTVNSSLFMGSFSNIPHIKYAYKLQIRLHM